MDEFNDDDRFLDAVDHIVLEALSAISDDPQARFALFRQRLAVAMEVAGVPADTGGPVNPARMS